MRSRESDALNHCLILSLRWESIQRTAEDLPYGPRTPQTSKGGNDIDFTRKNCLHVSPFVIPLVDRAIRLNLLIGCSLNRKLYDYEIILNSQFSILNFERQLDKPKYEDLWAGQGSNEYIGTMHA